MVFDVQMAYWDRARHGAGSSLRLATFLNLEAPAELTGLQRMQANRARELCMRAYFTDGRST